MALERLLQDLEDPLQHRRALDDSLHGVADHFDRPEHLLMYALMRTKSPTPICPSRTSRTLITTVLPRKPANSSAMAKPFRAKRR